MSATRVSDERIEKALLEYRLSLPGDLAFNIYFVIDALQDLKDDRDQLKTHQEMRNLYNKEPE